MTPPDLRGEVEPQERAILQTEGLQDWTIKDAADGYCWYDQKIIQRIPGDMALFLHEVAHAKCEWTKHDPLWKGDTTGHHAIWADCYTELVRKYLTRVRTEARREEQDRIVIEIEQWANRIGGFEAQQLVKVIRAYEAR